MWWIGLIIIAMLVIFYILYINGYMVTQVKKAIMYIESAKGTKASFSYCDGRTRRVVKFKESKEYCFSFSTELTSGNVSAEILDSQKKPILHLDKANIEGTAIIDKNERYYLLFRFNNASGKYFLQWN